MDKQTQAPQLPQNAVKCRFFAQYLGQSFINGIGGKSILCPVDLSYIEKDILVAKLLLRPLNKISDEHLLEIHSISGYAKSSDFRDNEAFKLECISESLEKIDAFDNGDVWNLHYEIIDFLRSKGYAIPFMNLSVEYFIKNGWVELIGG